MTRTVLKALSALGLAAMGATPVVAQGLVGWSICIDPTVNEPYQNFLVNSIANDLIRTTIGGNGTVLYGGQNSPCFPGQQAYNVAGRIGFSSGAVGSVQSTSDDDLHYTFGMPTEPGGPWSYANILTRTATQTTPDSVLLNNWNLFFVTHGNRTIIAQGTNGTTFVALQADVLGDAVKLTWDLTNNGTESQAIGLWYGALIHMIQDGNPPRISGDFAGNIPYVTVPGRKPLIVDERIIRAQSPSTFPAYIQFGFDQRDAYGPQFDLGPTPSTSDNTGQNSDATPVDELVVGIAFFILGDPYPPGANDVPRMPDFVFVDADLSETALIVKYQPGSLVPVNQTRRITQYVRNVWGNSRYAIVPRTGPTPTDRPYSTVVDAPHILPSDDQGTGGTNELLNNPFTLRVYLDNVGGYSATYTEVSVSDAHVTINLPPGMTLAPGEQQTKIISNIPARQVAFVDWQVEADGIEFGDLPYSVSVWSIPGPPSNRPMVINGIIRVAATKKIKLEPQANLISTPWIFADSSWEAVLGMNQPSDFTAYDWDPQQLSYVVSTAAARGKGTWIILNPNTHPSTEVVPYNGASAPPDTTTGAPNIQLRGGWNLIGNPYQYAFPLGQVVGVSASNPGRSFRWSDLVAQGIVNPFVAYWDPIAGGYRFLQGVDAMVQPNRGYWVKVNNSADLTFNFPAIYDTFVPPSGGGPNTGMNTWSQSPDHWRVNIQARSRHGSDEENYVGAVTNPNEASLLRIEEPPTGPVQMLNLSIVGGANSPLLAQSIRGRNVTQEWDVTVKANQSGVVTLTWPNIPSVPRNVGLRLVDPRTNQSLDMRLIHSATLNMPANSTRNLKVRATVNTVSQPLLGNIVATGGRLANSTPATMRIQLNEDANLTVRVLNSGGQLVSTLRDNQGSTQGENSVIWNLRNLSNGAVPAGTYRAEVRATSNGRSMTKTVNFSVVR